MKNQNEGKDKVPPQEPKHPIEKPAPERIPLSIPKEDPFPKPQPEYIPEHFEPNNLQ